MTAWTDEHGPDRLYDKFRVQRVRTGEFLPADEFVFPLRPEYDFAAWVALQTYADAVEDRSPNLAGEIRTRLANIGRSNS